MPDDVLDQGNPEGTPSDSGQGGNPAWSELLGVIPQELHSQVTPHLQKWDRGVQQRFEQVHSQYKPYKDFMDQGVGPDQINLALNIVRAISDEPETVWKQLGERYGFGQQPQGQPTGQGQPNLDDMWEGIPPELRGRLEGFMQEHQQLRQVSENMAQILLSQHQTDQDAEEDAKIDAMFQEFMKDPTFAALNEEGIAEPHIISRLMAGDTPEEALASLHKFVEHTLKTAGRPGAPRVMGAGGIIPGNTTDIRRATPLQARQAVANMFDAAMAAGD